MGSTVSICNMSNIVINVALIQISPLYFENALYPNKCVKRDVGRVWFTIEAVPWEKQSEYHVKSSISRILGITIDVTSNTATLNGDPEEGDASGEILKLAKHMSKFVSTLPDSETSSSVKMLRAVEEGVLMKGNLCINITGGPNKTMVTLPKDNYLDNNKQKIDFKGTDPELYRLKIELS